MVSETHSTSPDLQQLNERIKVIEDRLERLEKEWIPQRSKGLFISSRVAESTSTKSQISNSGTDKSMESRIGEYGMAWLGNLVLLSGILFLTQFLQNSDREILSLLLGFTAVAGVYIAGHYTRKSIPYLSMLFIYNGHVLLYSMAMRLHVFNKYPITENAFIGYGIVLLVIGVLVYLAFRNKSQIMAVIVWSMAIITAIASNSTHLMLSILTGITLTSIFFALRQKWWTGLVIAVVIIYLTFLLWIMGNPFISGTLTIISSHRMGYIYLFAIALAYSALALLPNSDRVPGPFLNAAILLNGLGFSLIMTLAVLAFFTHNYFVYFGLIAAFCMGYSIVLYIRGTWKNFASMYAIYSFVTLSITIAGIYKFPLAYFLLSIQSLLVVSMALWYRSRFIVIMNSILFLGLLITYLIAADTLNTINFSFAIVSLVTARILNWKKTRLEIRTELIRNLYLFAGAVMVLYSLHQAVPAQFVTLSWAISAMLFFVLSVLIRNIKYRWLAIITMILTVFYLFLVDLQNISLGYRIVALLFISVISLGISIFYTRRLKNREETSTRSDSNS